jgi:hypothetical protein
MSKRNYREELQRRREEAARRAATADPEPIAPEPETPEVRAELYKDQRDEARAALAREREKRQAAERRAQELEEPQGSLGGLLQNKRRGRRRPWK